MQRFVNDPDYIVEDIDVTSQFQHEKFVVKKNEFFY